MVLVGIEGILGVVEVVGRVIGGGEMRPEDGTGEIGGLLLLLLILLRKIPMLLQKVRMLLMLLLVV